MQRALRGVAIVGIVGLIILFGGMVSSYASLSSTIVRVSVSSAEEEANSFSGDAALSARGRYVAFASEATNLTPDGIDGGVFVRDLKSGTTELVSVSSEGVSGNGGSGTPALSAMGRFVAFGSFATDLVAGDTNGVSDIFVRDRKTLTTERVSVDSAGIEGDDGSYNPAVSADGRYVAFESEATNLVPNDTNNAYDVFVHDLQTGTTERVSVNGLGSQGDGYSRYPVLSAGGRYAAFHSRASNLVPGDTNETYDVFVHDLQAGTTERVSVNSDGIEGNKNSHYASLSAGGRYVAFLSGSNNLVPGDGNDVGDVFVHDRLSGTTQRVSVASDGVEGNATSSDPAISASGRYVAFESGAQNLVPGDTNLKIAIFVRDRLTGTTERISLSSAGTQGDDNSTSPAIGADGRIVGFVSRASLVPDDTNGFDDIYAHVGAGVAGQTH